MSKIERHPYILLSSVISLVMGVVMLFVNPEMIIGFVYYLLGMLLISIGLFKLNSEFKTKNDTYNGIMNIIIGIMIILFHNFIIMLLLGLTLLVFPIVRIIKSKYKKETFKLELPLIILGVIICFSGDLFANVFVKILGVLLILFAIYQFISIFKENLRIVKIDNIVYEEESKKKRNYVDVTYEEGHKNEQKK